MPGELPLVGGGGHGLNVGFGVGFKPSCSVLGKKVLAMLLGGVLGAHQLEQLVSVFLFGVGPYPVFRAVYGDSTGNFRCHLILSLKWRTIQLYAVVKVLPLADRGGGVCFYTLIIAHLATFFNEIFQECARNQRFPRYFYTSDFSGLDKTAHCDGVCP